MTQSRISETVTSGDVQANEIVRLTHAAEQGDLQAQLDLGHYFLTGNWIGEDDDACEMWFRKAKGQDIRLAIKWLRAAAEQGSAKAQNYLGNCCYGGFGCPADYEKAAEWFGKAAEQGYAEAVCNLGKCHYYWGHIVGGGGEEGVKLFKKASELGCLRADYLLGISYWQGRGIEENDIKAMRFIKKAARGGFAKARWHLGFYYLGKIDYDEDPARAFEREESLAQQGNAEAQFNLATHYYFGDGVIQNYKKAEFWYLKAAEQDLAPAIFRLCFMYAGNGIKRNKEEQKRWLLYAAEKGLPQAQYALGHRYCWTIGIDISYEESRKWLKKAADQGLLDAKVDWGTRESLEEAVEDLTSEENFECWATRENDVDPDFADSVSWLGRNIHAPLLEIIKTSLKHEALRKLEMDSDFGFNESEREAWARKTNLLNYYWNSVHEYYEFGFYSSYPEYKESQPAVQSRLEKSLRAKAKRGDAEAQYRLYYYLHIRCLSDEDLNFLQAAAGNGHAEAQFVYGMLLLEKSNDEGRERDAAQWVEKAAAAGVREAQYELGCLSMTGRGVSQNHKKAFRLFRKSAGQNYTPALFAVGYCYYHGLGTEADAVKAVSFFKKAAEQDSPRARYYLWLCYTNGNGVEKDEEQGLKYLQDARKQRFIPIHYRLALYALERDGSKENPDEAVSELEKVVERLYFSDSIHLGYNDLSINSRGEKEGELWTSSIRNPAFFFDGRMSEEDYFTESIRLLHQLAEKGSAQALYLLGFCRDHGKYAEGDEKSSTEYYRLSAEKGYAKAFEKLGYKDAAAVDWPDEVKDPDQRMLLLLRSILYHQKAAKRGDVHSQEILAYICYCGVSGFSTIRSCWIGYKVSDSFQKRYDWDQIPSVNSIDPDYDQAFKWARAAAGQGSSRGFFILGLCYRYGRGVDQDHVQAFKCFQKAALWDTDPKYYLGLCYLNGEGTKQNKLTGIKWLKKAAEGGCRDALFEIGVYCVNPKNNDRGAKRRLDWFIREAVTEIDSSSNEDYVVLKLAKCYMKGDRVEKSCSEALKWLRKAAAAGSENALVELGLYYLNIGIGDPEAAEQLEWVITTAGRERSKAVFRLAQACENGENVRADKEMADQLYMRAAELDNVKSIIHVALGCLESGDEAACGVESVKWYRKALITKSMHSSEELRIRYVLGRCYFYGIGTFQNYDNALKHLGQAAEGGVPEAKEFLEDIQI